MRDCIFLVADNNMRAVLEGFLSRDKFHLSLGCGSFDFISRIDLKVAAGSNDPGLFANVHEMLRPYRASHHHALVILDTEWEGSPGADEIVRAMTEKIISVGWASEDFRVLAIDPELENWIWQRNDHVAEALGFSDKTAMMDDQDLRTAWPEKLNKPNQPKEILEKILLKNQRPRSSAIYKSITSNVSVRACRDSAFLELKKALKKWFPLESGKDEDKL